MSDERFDWDGNMGSYPPENVVRDCLQNHETHEWFADAYIAGEFVQSWRRLEDDEREARDEEPMTDEEWTEYLADFREWLLKTLAKTARIMREPPKPRYQLIRHKSSGELFALDQWANRVCGPLQGHEVYEEGTILRKDFILRDYDFDHTDWSRPYVPTDEDQDFELVLQQD